MIKLSPIVKEILLKEETTENTMNDAFSRIKRLGKAFFTLLLIFSIKSLET
jgi:hypothetical protein